MNAAPAGTMAPSGDATGTSAGMQSEASAPTADIAYVQSLGADQHLVTDLDGQTVYASNAADAESAGEIDNFIVGADGTVVAAVVDMGSFLGDQSKTVAVPYDKIEWTAGENNQPRAVLTASRDELAAAPAFTVNKQPVSTVASNTTDDSGSTNMSGPGQHGGQQHGRRQHRCHQYAERQHGRRHHGLGRHGRRDHGSGLHDQHGRQHDGCVGHAERLRRDARQRPVPVGRHRR